MLSTMRFAASPALLSRRCMRSVCICEKAVSTFFTASAASRPSAVHALAEAEGEDEGEWVGEALGAGLGEAECGAGGLGECDGLADAEADGLALACVIVMVVTPPDTVAVTRAPVVPIRNTPAITPDFAWKNSSSRRSSKGNLLSKCSNEQGLRDVRGRLCPR